MLASGLKKCTTWAPSMSLASASSKSDGQSTSKQDSKSDFWPLLMTPCLDRDGGQSAFSTSNRRSLLPSLTCIAMYSCPSKCMSSLVLSTCLLLLRFLCRLPGRLILFILMGSWNATAADCRRCSTKSACCFFPSPCASMILRATLSGITSLVYIMTTSWLSASKGLPASSNDQCLGVCEKPLLNAWTMVMMLENGILPRIHACLKLRDDPSNFRSRHSPLGEDTLITQIEGPTMHLQLFILLLVGLVESNHCERVLRFGNGDKSISKLSIESRVFHSHVHHVAHVDREPAGVVVVIEN